MNYTAVAAMPAIILFFLDKGVMKYLDSDSRVLYEILGISVLFAHPLQQWSTAAEGGFCQDSAHHSLLERADMYCFHYH